MTIPLTGADRAVTTPRTLVTCRAAARTFGQGPGALVAVHGASCQVAAGERIAITGPSGSGKSTLLHLLAGLETPTAGEIGWPEFGATAALRARDIGVVFQGPSLLPALDVLENTQLPLLLADMAPHEARARAQRALARLGIEALARKLPEELSGGQAQRVAVARVLAQRPRLVLADEPTGQLDQATGHRVIDVLLATAEQLGAALVVTTHDPTVADRLPTRWTMHDGRLTTRAADPRSPAAPTAGPGDHS